VGLLNKSLCLGAALDVTIFIAINAMITVMICGSVESNLDVQQTKALAWQQVQA
jgi:hypothetical protein